MASRKILGGLVGFLVGITSCLSWIFLVILLVVRKRYKLLIIPCIYFILISIASLSILNINTKTEKLSDQITNSIFSAEYPTAGEYYNYTLFRRSIIRQFKTVTDVTQYNEKLNNQADLIVSRLYEIYKKEFPRNTKDNETFTLPTEGRESVKKEVNAFSEDYLFATNSSLHVESISMYVLFFISIIAFIPFSIVIFAKYLFQYKIMRINVATVKQIEENFNLTHTQSFEAIKEREDNGPFENIDDFIVRTGISQRTVEYIRPCLDFSVYYKTVRINYATPEQLIANIGLSQNQSSGIIEDRGNNGPFENMDNFISRTGLSQRIYDKIRPYLDFSFRTIPAQAPVERGGNTVPSNSEYRTVKINHATPEEISANLRLTSIQSYRIVNERAANGNFEGIRDFLIRSDLSPLICDTISPYLDFSGNASAVRERVSPNGEYRTVRVNYATAEDLSANVRLTSIQARTIINERETNGDFKDLSDFISRSGLSSRICNHIGHYLDFSYEEGKGRKGRVIEF